MIIDSHGHHVRRGYMGEPWWNGLASLMVNRAAALGQPVRSLEEAKKEFISRVEGSSGDAMVTALDEAGVDKIVICPLDFGLSMGDNEVDPVSVEQQNWEHCELAQRHPDRIIAFASVDPHRGKSGLQLFEKAVKEWGAKGLKLHPCSGWFPNEPDAYRFYEKAIELDVPVLIHTGFDPPPMRVRYAHPIYLDDVCIDFPQLRIAAGHMANIWRDELVRLSAGHPNLYMDMAGHAREAATDPVAFYRRLRQDIDRVGPNKVLFASDFVYGGVGAAFKQWVDAFKEIPKEVQEAGIQFTDKDLSGILGDNAQRWLGQ